MSETTHGEPPEVCDSTWSRVLVSAFGWANLLTLVRLLLALPSVLWILGGQWQLAALAYVIAVVTDVADGRVARARDEVTAAGGLFDHSVDAVFAASALFAFAYRGDLNWLLPVLVVVSFVQYAADSKALRGQPLRASTLGRYNGIGYFVVVAIALVQHATGFPGESIVAASAWALICTTLISMTDRALAYRALRSTS